MNLSGKHNTRLALGVLFICALLPNIISGAHHDELIELRAAVEKVTDGDTIEVRMENGTRETIRFWGIDAPESYLKRFGYIEFMGDEAKKFTQNSLTGKNILLKTLRRGDDFLRDKYQRILAFVYVDTIDIADILLKKGLAKVYRKSTSPRHVQFIKIESDARARKAGIWDKESEKKFYRTQYAVNHNKYLIIWFFEHDKDFLRQLLHNSVSR